MKRRHYSNFFILSARKTALIFCACLLAAVAVPKLWAAASLPPDLITSAQGQAFEGEWIADFKARNDGQVQFTLRYEERKSTVYREEVSTQTRDIERVVQIPVTEYEWEAYWVNRWNPFATPYIAYQLVPRTRVELRTETVRTPITSSRLIPVGDPRLHRALKFENA